MRTALIALFDKTNAILIALFDKTNAILIALFDKTNAILIALFDYEKCDESKDCISRSMLIKKIV
jgi:hypothetical protein